MRSTGKSTPWWGRCDLDDAHIFRAADGRPVLIDVFCMAGTELYRAILEDVAEVYRRIPREWMRYALDIPYIARENSTAEILALKKAGHALPDDHARDRHPCSLESILQSCAPIYSTLYPTNLCQSIVPAASNEPAALTAT